MQRRRLVEAPPGARRSRRRRWAGVAALAVFGVLGASRPAAPPLDISPEHRDGGRGYAGNAAGLSQGGRPGRTEPRHDLRRQSGHVGVGEAGRDEPPLVLRRSGDRGFLPAQVPFVLHRRLDARPLRPRGVLADLEGHDPLLGQRGQAHLRPPEHPGRGDGAVALPDARRPHPRQVPLEPRTTVAEAVPSSVVHEAHLAAARRQAQVRVVDPQQQAMFGPRREHAVRLETSPGREVVDHDPDVGLAAPQHPAALAAGAPGRVDPRHQTLSRRFLVSRGAVDLPGEIEPRDFPGLQGQPQLRRLDEVVLDRVARTQHDRVLQPRQRGDNLLLHVSRQAHRAAADVDLGHVQPFRLKEDLVPLAVRKPHHLVFQRRAVPGPDPGDPPVVERRPIPVPADQLVHLGGRMDDVTADLAAVDDPAQERERHRRAISRLFFEAAEVDAGAVEPGRRPRLQPPPRQAQALQRLPQNPGRRLAGPTRRALLRADVDQPVQERPRGHDHRAATGAGAVFELDADDACVLDQDGADPAHDPVDVGLPFESRPHPGAVPALVRLRPRRLHGRPAAAVQQLELDRGGVDGLAHQAAEGVDLAHEVALGGAPDGGVARHLPHRLPRQRAQPHRTPQAGGSVRRLDAGVSGPDDDDVVIRCHHGSLR